MVSPLSTPPLAALLFSVTDVEVAEIIVVFDHGRELEHSAAAASRSRRIGRGSTWMADREITCAFGPSFASMAPGKVPMKVSMSEDVADIAAALLIRSDVESCLPREN